MRLDTSPVAQTDPLGVALGVQFEPFPIAAAASAVASSTQVVRATAVYATAGAVITGVKIRNAVAAAGTLPTTVRFGLADNTGKILALSGNANSLAAWATGVCPFTLTTDGGTTKYVTTYSGIYYPCFVINGVWGTTQPTPILASIGGATAAATADGSNPIPVFIWSSQADLPAVGSSLTMSGASQNIYWLALY